MKLEEMRKIAEKRTPGEWTIEPSWVTDDDGNPDMENPTVPQAGIGDNCLSGNNARFIVMAANNWDKLMAVVEAAKHHLETEGIDCVAQAVEAETMLRKALESLERE